MDPHTVQLICIYTLHFVGPEHDDGLLDLLEINHELWQVCDLVGI